MEPDVDYHVQVERRVYQQEKLHEDFHYQKPKVPFKDKCKDAFSDITVWGTIKKTVPVLTWLPRYNWKEDFVSDIISGSTVAVMHIPQGMGYALLGGVPAITGIYMALFPVFIYFIFGTSKHISMGTFAVISLMVGKSVTHYANVEDGIPIPANMTETAVSPMQVATMLAFMVGGMQILMSIFKLGIVCTLLSETLVSGFTTAAAIHVFTSQIKDLLGIKLKKFEGVFNIGYTYIDIFSKLSTVNWASIVVSAVALTMLLVNNEIIKPRISKYSRVPIPIELVVVITGTLTSIYVNLEEEYGLRTVGHIPTGLPEPKPPTWYLVKYLVLDAFTITMVAYTIAMSMALIFAQKWGYEVDSNQELLAQGAGNIFGSFFSCMPFTASLSRTLIQTTAGGKTQLCSVISCSILIFVLLWIGPFFEPLPRCVLASIIMVALKGMLMQVKELFVIWKLSKMDGMVWIITFLTVVLVDIDYGLFTGMGLSLGMILLQGVKGYTCLLGVIPSTDLYLDTSRYKAASEIPGIKIFHYRGGLNFATRANFRDEIYRLVEVHPQKLLHTRKKMEKKQAKGVKVDEEKGGGFVNFAFVETNDIGTITQKEPPIPAVYEINSSVTKQKLQCIILDFSALSFLDPSGAKALQSLAEEYKQVGIPIMVAGSSGTVYERLKKFGIIGDPDKPSFSLYATVHDAVIHAQTTLLDRNIDIRM
ncbi:prestin [Hetaerina americana]|uniref:prestin n=1 Tax=Hetaerina americana TaxID=62018 RepID=UPI003A7F4B7E